MEGECKKKKRRRDGMYERERRRPQNTPDVAALISSCVHAPQHKRDSQRSQGNRLKKRIIDSIKMMMRE